MYLKFLNILLFSIFSASVALANPKFIIPAGSAEFAGQLLDTSKFRAAEIIANTGDEIIFDNYFHNNQFWIAKISKNAKIDGLFINIVEFEVVPGVTAAHVQTRVRFAEGSEIMLAGNGKVQYVKDIVFSSEAGRPEGVGYNFLKGIKDNYMLVPRIASGTQRVGEYTDDFSTIQYELEFDADERMDYLITEILDSSKVGLGNFYGSLKPNCVTERFRVLDQIITKRGNVKPVPFLTMFSNDPVSGPTLDALKERGVLGKRVANLETEIETKIPFYIPSRDERDKKADDSKKNILAEVDGFPYSLIFVASEELQNNPDFINAKKEAYKLLPQFIENVLASVLTKNLSSGEPALLAAFKELSPVIQDSLTQMTEALGDTDQAQFSLYFSPWDQKKGREIDVLKELKVDARLPLKTYEANDSLVTHQEIHAGLNDALVSHIDSEVNFGALGLAIHVNLDNKGEDSSLKLQAVGHLGELERPLDVKNDQVTITSLVVPQVSAFNTKPVALFNLKQDAVKGASPDMKISFGSLGGLDQSSKTFGEFFIESRFGDKSRSKSVPSILGTVPQSKGLIAVWMDIFSVDFDLKNLSVKDMDIRLSTGINLGFTRVKTSRLKNLESDPDINSQFTDSVNTQIREQARNLGSSTVLSFIEQLTTRDDAVESASLLNNRNLSNSSALSCKSLL